MAKRNILPLVLCLIMSAVYFDLVMQLDASFNGLSWSNETLKLVTIAQHKDIIKCLSKLPEEDVKAFYSENREELNQRLMP